MDFALSADQVALQDTVRAVCAKRFQSADVRRIGAGGGVEPASWADLVDLGVFDLRIPAERGGVGLGLADAVLVLEELGRHLVPGPVVASELAVAVAGLQPCLAALVERDASPLLVECLPALDVVLVMDADGLWSVAPSGLEAEPVARPLDPLAPLHRIRRLPRGDQLGGPELVARVRLEGATLTAAYLTGSAAAVTDLAVEHARIREQFDRPIGSFQAVKHLLADMVVRAAVAQAAVHAAGVTVDEAGDESGESLDDDRAAAWAVSRAVSTAKVLAGEAAVRNAKSALQVHGGMGYTWDVDVHLHLKRAWHLNTTFGTPDEHALRLVEQQPRS